MLKRRDLTAALCVAIAVADLAQVALFGKGLGAIGGAILYGLFAAALARHWTWVYWLVRAMPVVPLAVFSGLLGVETRDQLVDAGMLAVFVLQVLAAGATLLRGEPPAVS